MRTILPAVTLTLLSVCLLRDTLPAQELPLSLIERQDGLERIEIEVADLTRRFLLYVPKDQAQPAPVVFAFHGHGGNAIAAARSFRFQKHWPDAIIVYMQGIPTPGPLTDPEGKRNGWQHGAGDQGDRDLKFFDAVLNYLKDRYKVDELRIYSTGHSNGGGFTYLLWQARGDLFAAMAPSASAARYVRNLKPKPVMHLAGEKDTLVKYEWQAVMMQALRKTNQCEETGSAWAEFATEYTSAIGTPVVTYIHPGTHQYPAEAPPLIVKFFKEHTRPPQK